MKIIQLDKDVLFNQYFNSQNFGISKVQLNSVFNVINIYLQDTQQNDPDKLKQSQAGTTTSQARRKATRALIRQYAIDNADRFADNPKMLQLRTIAKAIGKNELTVRLVLNEVANERGIIVEDSFRKSIPEILQRLIIED